MQTVEQIASQSAADRQVQRQWEYLRAIYEQMENQGAVDRQVQRHPSPLSDRSNRIERAARNAHTRDQVVFAYGNFLASLIADGEGWFVTITIADRAQSFAARRRGKRTLRGKIRRHYTDCSIRYGHADRRIERWTPASKLNRPFNPVTRKILDEVRIFMEIVEKAVGSPIGYIIAEEIGALNGRWHLHLLVSGVASLYRKVWWSALYQLFGRTRIELYRQAKAVSFYAAKYAAKQLGSIHLCGTFFSVNLEICDSPKGFPVGGNDVACSDAMSSEFYRSHVTQFRKPCFADSIPGRVWRQSKRQRWISFEVSR